MIPEVTLAKTSTPKTLTWRSMLFGADDFWTPWVGFLLRLLVPLLLWSVLVGDLPQGLSLIALLVSWLVLLTAVIGALKLAAEHFPHGDAPYLAVSKEWGPRTGLWMGLSQVVVQMALLALLVRTCGEFLEYWLGSGNARWWSLLCVLFAVAWAWHRGRRTEGYAVWIWLAVWGTLFLLALWNGSDLTESVRLVAVDPSWHGFALWLPSALIAVFAGFVSFGSDWEGQQKVRWTALLSSLRWTVVVAIGVGTLWLLDLSTVEVRGGISFWDRRLGEGWWSWGLLGAFFVLLLWTGRSVLSAGRRALSALALDYWMPRSWTLLSESWAARSSYALVGLGAFVLALITPKLVDLFVILGVGVALVFGLLQTALLRTTLRHRRRAMWWWRRVVFLMLGVLLCFAPMIQGLWTRPWAAAIGLGLMLALLGLAFFVRLHYKQVRLELERLDRLVISAESDLSADPAMAADTPIAEEFRRQPTAILWVDAYDGIAIHTILTLHRLFRGHFKNVVVLQVGLLNSGAYKGRDAVGALEAKIQEDGRRFRRLLRNFGLQCETWSTVDTDPSAVLQAKILELIPKFPKAVVFTGSLLFRREGPLHRLLHNDQRKEIEHSLRFMGVPVLVLPVRADLGKNS